MSGGPYIQGELVVIASQFYDQSNKVASPNEVIVRVKDPSGNITTPVVTVNPNEDGSAPGNYQRGNVYTIEVDTTSLSGTYTYFITSAVPYQSAFTNSFSVNPSGF
jgi:hypothetical protein